MYRHATGGYKWVSGGSGRTVIVIIVVSVSGGLWALYDPLAAGGTAGVDPQPLVHALVRNRKHKNKESKQVGVKITH